MPSLFAKWKLESLAKLKNKLKKIPTKATFDLTAILLNFFLGRMSFEIVIFIENICLKVGKSLLTEKHFIIRMCDWKWVRIKKSFENMVTNYKLNLIRFFIFKRSKLFLIIISRNLLILKLFYSLTKAFFTSQIYVGHCLF